ncbi:MAG: hypothetical protein J1F32_01650 [Erysipelotrichales bacterium]|nr:hypothetical protein [Erysipelotrichales bacterium]
MNKLLLGLNSLLLLASSLIPGLIKNNTTTAVAEEKTIVSGKASSYLQQKNKEYFDDEDTEFINTTYPTKYHDDYEVFEYNTDLMDSYADYVYENKIQALSLLYKSNSSNNPLNKTQLSNTALFIAGGTYCSLFDLKGTFNYEFERIENDKGQALPIEFKLDLGTDFFEFYKKLFLPYQYDLELPLLEIDGQTILSLEKTGNDFTLTTSDDAHVYLDKTTDSSNAYNKNRFVYVEIPYRRHIETVSAKYWRIYTGHERSMLNNYGFITIGTYEFLVQNLYLEKDCYNHSVFGPILINNIDFNTGVMSTISSVSANRYVVDSIVINDDLEIECKIRNLDLFHNVLDFDNSLYEKMQQYNLKYNGVAFTYDTASCDFFEQLKNAKQEVDFYITEIKYHITLGKLTNEVSESLMVTPDDWKRTLDPTAKFGKDKIESLVQLPSRLKNQSSSTYAVTAAADEPKNILDYVIDCGQYYKFKYVDKTTIHTAKFEAREVESILSPYTRLFFNVYDSVINCQIDKLHGIKFYYTLASEKNKVRHSFDILSGDGIQAGIAYDGNVFQHPIIDYVDEKNNHVTKKDESTGVEFTFQGVSLADQNAYTFIGEFGRLAPYTYVIYNRGVNLDFDSLIECFYINEAGDIVNASAMTWGNHSGLTAFDKNGDTVIMDDEGNELPLHYDEETGTLKDPIGNEVEPPDNIFHKETFWDKLGYFFTNTFKWIAILVVIVAVVFLIKWILDEFGKKPNKRT